MSNLATTYLGLPMASPVIVAASSLTGRIDTLRRAEEAGAGAVVIRSLFEEQIYLDGELHEEELAVGGESYAEATGYFPSVPHGDCQAHLQLIENVRKAVKLPIIASLNAFNPGSWTRYARRIEEAGADAIELNVYSVATDLSRTSREVESDLYEIADRVTRTVGVPVSVKLSPFYTALAHVVGQLDVRAVRGAVLFNRFLQPDIDPERMALRSEMPLSSREEMRLPLRWVGILHGRVNMDLCLNTGVQSGADVIRALLAGAKAVQVAGTLLRNGVPYLSTMLRALELWMGERDYETPDDFRGELSQKAVSDPFAFERAQYVGLLQSR